MTPEGKVKAAVVTVLTAYGPRGLWYYMPVQGGFGQQGIPDFIACYRGRMLGIECKANGGKLTNLQALQLSRMNNAGAVTMVINSVPDVATLMAHLQMLGTE